MVYNATFEALSNNQLPVSHNNFVQHSKARNDEYLSPIIDGFFFSH